MRYPITPFGFRETLRPNVRVLHDMIHCADESLCLHGYFISDATLAATTSWSSPALGREDETTTP